MGKSNIKMKSLRSAGLPLSRAARHAQEKRGLPAWAIGGVMIGVVGAVGLVSVVALGFTQEPVQTTLVIPTEAELETLQQTASAIEKITAARIVASAEPVPAPVEVQVEQDPTPVEFTFQNDTDVDDIVTRNTPDLLAIAPTPVATNAACLSDLMTALSGQVIPFDVNSTEVAEPLRANLRTVASSANACSNVQIVVEGHSDASGSDYDNLQLSWQRAEAVIELIADMGFDTSIYEPMGFGARTATDGGSRRVSFRVTSIIQANAADN